MLCVRPLKEKLWWRDVLEDFILKQLIDGQSTWKLRPVPVQSFFESPFSADIVTKSPFVNPTFSYHRTRSAAELKYNNNGKGMWKIQNPFSFPTAQHFGAVFAVIFNRWIESFFSSSRICNQNGPILLSLDTAVYTRSTTDRTFFSIRVGCEVSQAKKSGRYEKPLKMERLDEN